MQNEKLATPLKGAPELTRGVGVRKMLLNEALL
jgi:hypothetical protein